MKKTIIFAALSLITACGFAQVQNTPYRAEDSVDMSKGNTGKMATAPVLVPNPVVKQFAIVLSEADLIKLYDFITNADIYSDKGRQNFLANLDKHVVLLPTPAATAKPKK